jgi:hypothetical protein
VRGKNHEVHHFAVSSGLLLLPQHLDTENLQSFNVTYVTVMLSLSIEVLIFGVLLNAWVSTFMHVLALWH